MPVGTIRPAAYIELHVEQGPILAHEGISIGSVDRLQGISWQRVTVHGDADHAGTTPMGLRRDAGHAAARIITFMNDFVRQSNAPTVTTIGTISFDPNAINVIPSKATLTVDIRDADEERLKSAEQALGDFLRELSVQTTCDIETERLARFEPVIFDERIAAEIDASTASRGFSVRRMVYGAGHDAQMMARICPTAMIFVPSARGISHSPDEWTADEDLVRGALVLSDVAVVLISASKS